MSARRSLATLLLLTVTLAAPATTGRAADALPPLSISDMMAITHLHDAKISPDGRHVALVTATADFARNGYRFRLSLVDAATGERKKLHEGYVPQAPCWSPDSHRLAVVELVERDVQVRIYDLPSQSLVDPPIAAPSEAEDLTWSPDGKRIALRGIEPDDADDQRQRLVDTILESKEEPPSGLYVIDVAAAECRQLPHAAGHVPSYCWSPDSGQLVYELRPSAGIVDLDTADLRVIALATDEDRALVVRPGGDSQPCWSPDGEQIAFLSQRSVEGYLQPYALCVVSAAGGEPRNVDLDLDATIARGFGDAPSWTPDSKALRMIVDEGVARNLYRVDLATGGATPLAAGMQVRRDVSYTADGKTLAAVIATPDVPGDLYLSPTSAYQPQRLVELNPQLAERSLADWDVVQWTSDDGATIEGMLYTPADRHPDQPAPLITYLHGGPAGNFAAAFSPETWMTVPQLGMFPVHVLAGRGYAVFCPNPRGSDGYGRQHREAVVAKWGEIDLQDVTSGIDELVRRRIADPERLAIGGYCYGGYLSLQALTRSDRFDAACLGACFGDMAAVYGQTDIPNLFDAYFGGPPWEHRAAYDRASPMRRAHLVTTPSLLLHARNDLRIPWTQSKELFTTLQGVGTPVELITYPRGDHVNFESRMHAETMRQVILWLDKWVDAHPASAAELPSAGN